MSITSTQVTVGDTPTILYTSPGVALVYVEAVDGKSAPVVRIGGSTVTVVDGVPVGTIAGGLQLLQAAESLYGIVVQGGSALVNVLASVQV